jgi:hypothetical protein
VIPVLLAALGLAALTGAILVLRTFGPRYRVGRLLATTPRVSVTDALALAAAGTPRYVRIDGRIDAEDEFEDLHHRPLVFRRTRLEARRGRDWEPFEDSREVVRFEVREGLDAIAVDGDALGDGLVVVPRESVGVAGDLPDRVPETLAADTPVRVRIEQISSIEHATVLGVPVARDGVVTMTSGTGRPLVLTTLAPDEAMRILADGRATRPRVAAALLAAAAVLLLAALVAALIGPPLALGATPSAAPSFGPGPAGDPRSEGEGPGLVGNPALAILGVLAVGAGAALATLVWVRLTGRNGRASR